MTYRILAINPGSTSTKVGLFDGDICVFAENVAHNADKLASLGDFSNQMDYRRDTILDALRTHDIDLLSIDAFVGRGGGLLPLEGGTYRVNSTLLNHALSGANGVQHPANLGSVLAHEFAHSASESDAKPCFVVNPPDTDELCDSARMTGINGIFRHVHLHALNLKETAIRHASLHGRAYEDCKFIVCHIGGGISVSAHEHGRMIDGNDIVGGEGPLTPTRCGSIPVAEILNYLKANNADIETTRKLCVSSGGFANMLGTSDALEVQQRAENGDAQAARAWDAMIYQICKWIGAMACALKGDIDGILLSGGMVHSESLVHAIRETCEWIAPVSAYPGEFEMEAMAAGATRVLDGKEEAKEYLGVPVWSGFSD